MGEKDWQTRKCSAIIFVDINIKLLYVIYCILFLFFTLLIGLYLNFNYIHYYSFQICFHSAFLILLIFLDP